MIANSGRERGLFVLKRLEEHARDLGIKTRVSPYSAYQNTIPLEQQAVHPGDMALEERIMAIVRWNALAMVVRANKEYGELGGHIASYASAAEIFETGFNHFFRGPGAGYQDDLVYLSATFCAGRLCARLFGRSVE